MPRQNPPRAVRAVLDTNIVMDMLHFRSLAEPGGPFYDAHQANPASNRFVKALAAEIQVADIDSETGEAIMRDGIAADRFPHPYPNATAAAAGNGGAVPPDMSNMSPVIAKLTSEFSDWAS